MYQQLRIIIAFMSLLLLFSACNKEDETTLNAIHRKISPDLQKYLFDSGSYWIYKDSSTTSIDSTVVTSISKDIFLLMPTAPGQGVSGDEEYFTINYTSFPSNTNYSEEIVGSIISRGHAQGGVTYISSNNVGETIYNAQIEDVIDSLIVEGHPYHHVVKMRIQSDNFISANYNFYYVDSIGIIRKETRIGESIAESWNLVRYEVSILPY